MHRIMSTSGCAGLSVILILYLWGSCIAYLVIIGDSFSPLVALATGMQRPAFFDKQAFLHLCWKGIPF